MIAGCSRVPEGAEVTGSNGWALLTVDDRYVHRLFLEETARWHPGGYQDHDECDGPPEQTERSTTGRTSQDTGGV